jgi:hypothetical protein
LVKNAIREKLLGLPDLLALILEQMDTSEDIWRGQWPDSFWDSEPFLLGLSIAPREFDKITKTVANLLMDSALDVYSSATSLISDIQTSETGSNSIHHIPCSSPTLNHRPIIRKPTKNLTLLKAVSSTPKITSFFKKVN